MMPALSVLVLALVLSVAVMTWIYQTVSAYRMSDAMIAAAAAGLPFFGGAFLAALEALERRKPPAVRVLHSHVQELLLLLVLTGLWVFFILLIWDCSDRADTVS